MKANSPEGIAAQVEKYGFQKYGLNFGQAVELMKSGQLLARSGWNGKGMFIFMMMPKALSIGSCLKGGNGMPSKFKDYVENKHQPITQAVSDILAFQQTPYFVMKAADETLVNGWLASQTDMLAEDWELL